MTAQFSQKAIKFEHFHNRTGSYSTRGTQNGRVDVLPPEAKEAFWTGLEVIKQYELLQQQMVKRREEYRKLGHLKAEHPARQEALARLHAAKSRVGDYKTYNHCAKMQLQAVFFKEVCRRRMHNSRYIELAREAEELQAYFLQNIVEAGE